MRLVFKITVAILISGVLAVSAAAVSPQPMHRPSAPAGCHHGGETPSPQPVNYTCCQAGHNAALLQSPHQQEMPLAGISRGHVFVSNLVVTSSSFESSDASILVQPPPGGLPLRI